MKICIITSLYHPFALGGRERYITTLVSELLKNNEIVVLTTKSLVEDEYKIESKEKIIELKPINVGSAYEMLTKPSTHMTFKKLLWHFFDLWNIATYLQIKNAINSEKPDLIFVNGIRGLSSSVFSAVNHSNLPQIYIIHDFELISRWSGLYRNGKNIEKFNFFEKTYINYMQKNTSKLNAVISPSKFLMDFHLKHGFFKNSKRFIVPNGVKLKNNPIVRDRISNEFLFIGQIEKHKGPQIAVKAFKKINDENLKLHVVGRGSYLDELKKISENDARIIFHGFVKNDELKNIFERCSYAIFPSLWYENYPLVIYEVMSEGIPVIASNIGGVPELVQEGYNGFLFPPGNVDSLTEIIKQVTNDNKTLNQLSRNSISTSQKFKLENQINIIQDIFDTMVKV